MVVTKNKLLKLSLYSIIIALILFLINYYVFHFVSDDGFTLIWHEEAGKPFVSNLIGQLAVSFVFLSGASLLCSYVFFKKEK